jgi:hypothetical protein
MKLSGRSILYNIALLIFCAIVYGYGQIAVIPLIDQYSSDTPYGHIANFHDHFQYLAISPEYISDYGVNISTLNVFGIGSIYFFISAYLENFDVIEISSFINLVAVIFSGLIHRKICRILGLSNSSHYLFFLNLPIIYYSQLVGKDIIFIALLYAMMYAYLSEKYILVVAIGLLGAFVRVQFPLYSIFLIFIQCAGSTKRSTYVFLYVITSLLGAYAMNHSGAIGDYNDLEAGVTSIVYKINEYIPIGNLLLNPVRLVQNILLFISAPIVGLFSGNVFYILMSPMVLYIVLRITSLSFLIKGRYNKIGQFIIVAVLVLLAYPIINTRYIALIVPFIILSLAYIKKSGVVSRHR